MLTSVLWRRVRRYRGRLAFLGAALAAGGFFAAARAQQPDGGWFEVAAWSVGVFVVSRWALKKTIDSMVNYVTSGLKDITGE